MQNFKTIIIGRGLMGSAAARYVSMMSDGVAMIGPSEPQHRKFHDGVFASHYDEARITRIFDGSEIWAELARRSMKRYDDIEAKSGISFFEKAGCLFAGNMPGNAYLTSALNVAEASALEIETLKPPALKSRFPQFRFDADMSGFFESDAGYINPRELIRAQTALANHNNATVIDQTVSGVRDCGAYVEIITDDASYRAERVLVAAGSFTNLCGLLPQPVDINVMSRTVVFFELGQREQAIFDAMPSTIIMPENMDDLVYILPPVRYPDGKTYLKLGGDCETRVFTTLNTIGEWFRSDGDPTEIRHLSDIARKIMPEIADCPMTSAPCTDVFTPTCYPYIGWTQSPRIGVLTGGNFVAAKSSDELGRLGAELITNGQIEDDHLAALFSPLFKQSSGSKG